MAQDRPQHWDGIYRDKEDARLSWHQDDPAISLELCALAEIGAGSSVIDIGAGTSRFAARLIERGIGEMAVLDVSGAALERAREAMGPIGERIDWITADVTTWTPTRRYDLWHDRAVFHFLVDAHDRAAYRERLRGCLNPGGHAIIATFAPDGPETCSGLPVARYDPEALVLELGEGFTLAAHRRHVHHTPWGTPQPFQYSLLRMEA